MLRMISPHILRKLVKVSALKQLAERIKLLYYNKEEIDTMLVDHDLYWETFGEDSSSPEEP